MKRVKTDLESARFIGCLLTVNISKLSGFFFLDSQISSAIHTGPNSEGENIEGRIGPRVAELRSLESRKLEESML
jgi:hypothetical protein